MFQEGYISQQTLIWEDLHCCSSMAFLTQLMDGLCMGRTFLLHFTLLISDMMFMLPTTEVLSIQEIIRQSIQMTKNSGNIHLWILLRTIRPILSTLDNTLDNQRLDTSDILKELPKCLPVSPSNQIGSLKEFQYSPLLGLLRDSITASQTS